MTEPVRCLIRQCDRPGEWTSPTGHTLCAYHHDIYKELDLEPEVEGPQPVDLYALMWGEPTGAEWTIEPVLPAGKLVAIVSKRGDGKSLLMLDLAARVATGQATLHQPEGTPIHVLYLDMEMGPDDLYDRLSDLGYTPQHPQFDALRGHLHYYLLPSLPALDTEEGGLALEELADRHGATLVVIDTISRVVSGDENAAEPYRDLFRHTETRLKRRRITLARLDHLGKDATRGSRGSSAKEDPMDVVWHLTIAAGGAIVLNRTKGRQSWIPQSVTIYRDNQTDGTIRHTIHQEPKPDWLDPLVANIRDLELPLDSSSNQVFLALKAAGKGAQRGRVYEAVRVLRQPVSSQNKGVPKKVGTPLFDENGYTPGYTPVQPEKTLEEANKLVGTPSGTTGEPPVPGEYPTIVGYTLEGHPLKTDFDDFEPDPDDLPEPW